MLRGMATQKPTYTCSPSTSWTMKKVMLAPPAQGERALRSGAPSALALPYRDARKSLWVEVRYLAGAEAWWSLEARGVLLKAPGHQFLHDALATLNGLRGYGLGE